MDRCEEFEAILSREEGFEIWETAKGCGSYKYADTHKKYKDFLAGVYPYKVNEIPEDRKVMIEHLRKQAADLYDTSLILDKQADLLERGYELDQVGEIVRKDLWWLYCELSSEEA